MYLDSGRIDSTFLTFGGLSAAPGRMASTRTLSKVQEVECLNCWISGGNGSEEVLPHSVPEHPDVDPPVVMTGPPFVTTEPVDDAVSPPKIYHLIRGCSFIT